LRIVRLPDEAIAVEDDARDRLIKTIVLEHWRETRGHVPAFGAITGYIVVVLAGCGGFDFAFPYSVAGDPAGGMQRIERLGEATLGQKRAIRPSPGYSKISRSK
jgi:hypothetical protein